MLHTLLCGHSCYCSQPLYDTINAIFITTGDKYQSLCLEVTVISDPYYPHLMSEIITQSHKEHPGTLHLHHFNSDMKHRSEVNALE